MRPRPCHLRSLATMAKTRAFGMALFGCSRLFPAACLLLLFGYALTRVSAFPQPQCAYPAARSQEFA
jgi:hypothetical protein